MSFEAQAWARRITGLRPVTKFVLMVLANATDPQGTCYPSRARIGKEIGISKRTVSRCVAELEGFGLVLREKRVRADDGRRSSNLYRVGPPEGFADAMLPPVDKAANPPVAADSPHCQERQQPPCPAVHPPLPRVATRYCQPRQDKNLQLNLKKGARASSRPSRPPPASLASPLDAARSAGSPSGGPGSGLDAAAVPVAAILERLSRFELSCIRQEKPVLLDGLGMVAPASPLAQTLRQELRLRC